MKRFLNTRVWLTIVSLLALLGFVVGVVFGEAVDAAPDYWDRDLTPFETDMASVIELVWVAHVTFIGVIILAIGLMASERLRARLGAIAIGSLGGSQLLAGSLASGYGYQFADGAAAGAPFFAVTVLGLAACVANWNAAPAPEAVDR
ncbi:MAG: hypothetical protein ACO4BY_11900 [Candidatus Nanopelagicales bacterium]